MRVENGTGACSPSRFKLSGVNTGTSSTSQQKPYILTLTGMFTAPELANEKGSIVHLISSRLSRSVAQ
jgi:hypothetical protein